ncbi:MAG: HD-GYP domain-containing protein [Chloroflexi bacterium]|nr:HD-GYP domain-containing protein [Chloroflexota bacterium]
MQLARSLYNHRGDVLLARGTTLNPAFISSINQRGYHSVYIMDGIADDVEPLGLVSQRLRSATVRNLDSMFELVATATKPVVDQAKEEGAHVLREVPPKLATAVERQMKRLEDQVEQLLGEALEAHILQGVASLKSHDNYTFEHSVDVAVYGVMLGRKLALPHEYLRDLALGCLLHDIGKMYVDERVISKPGKLTPAEFKQVMRHTVLGFQLMRQMPISSPRPAHVALQHHEHQSGSGYPNGLVGTNKIFRTPRERFDTTRMTLLAELAAVADVCSALSSDRPQRGAMAPPEVLAHLRRMAGEHLNAEAVEAFVSMVEVYPVGVHVRFGSGKYAGYYGVVVECRPSAPNRPLVRLLFDASGAPEPEGVEIDLRKESDDPDLTAVPEGGMSLEEHARRVASANLSASRSWPQPASALTALRQTRPE